MALNKQIVNIGLTGGVDTKTSEKIVPMGFFLTLRNIVRVKTGELRKRFGFSNFSRNVFGQSSSITSGQRLTTFNNDLVMVNNQSLFSYARGNDEWIAKGSMVSAQVESDPIVRNSAVQAMPDVASFGGITVSVWEDSRGGIRCTVSSDATDSFPVSDVQISSTGSRPHVCVLNGTFLVAYRDSTSFKCRLIPYSSPSSIGAEQVLESGLMADMPWAMSTYNNVAFFVYSTSSSIRIGYINSSGIIATPANGGYPAPVTLVATPAVCCTALALPESQILYVLYGASDNSVNQVVISPDFSSIGFRGLGIVTNVCNVTAVSVSGTLTAYWESSAASSINTLVYTQQITSTTISSLAVFLRSVGLASTAFALDSRVYVNVAYESQLQSTYFTVRDDGLIVARMQAGLGGGLTRGPTGALKSGLTSVVSTGPVFNFPIRIRTRLTSEVSTVQSAFIGLNMQTLTFNTNLYNSDTIGQNLIVGGGILTAYDGQGPVELGFNVYPDNVTVSSTGSGNLTAAGQYRIQCLYEWYDAQGQIHRSGVSIDTTGGTAASGSGGLTVTVPNLRLTQKTGNRADARIVFYTTIAGGTTVFYRAGDIPNDPTTDSQTVVIGETYSTAGWNMPGYNDTSLQSQEILYTTGGVLNNDPAPSASIVHVHKNRVFTAGQEDPYTVNYTRVQTFGEGAAFSNGQTIRLIPRGGPVSALGTLDENLIIFKDNAMFIQSGDGPTDAGTSNDYQEPQLISSDVGCSNQRSLVITPNGLMFQSQKGIYLLGRDLSTQYIGAGVESYNDLTITSATLLDGNNEVRFTTSNGDCLVYNYIFGQWSTFSNYAATDGCMFLSDFVHLKSDGTVCAEVEGQYNDAGLLIPMQIETNWIQIAKVQGYQRVYRWALLGDFVSHHICRVSAAYDYEPGYNEIVYFQTQEGLGTDTFGSDAVYGESSVYGGTDSQVFQFRCKPRRQKCESIKLLIEDVDTLLSAGGGSFNLVSIALEIGVKTGINKMSTLKTRGS